MQTTGVVIGRQQQQHQQHQDYDSVARPVWLLSMVERKTQRTGQQRRRRCHQEIIAMNIEFRSVPVHFDFAVRPIYKTTGEHAKGSLLRRSKQHLRFRRDWKFMTRQRSDECPLDRMGAESTG